MNELVKSIILFLSVWAANTAFAQAPARFDNVNSVKEFMSKRPQFKPQGASKPIIEMWWNESSDLFFMKAKGGKTAILLKTPAQRIQGQWFNSQSVFFGVECQYRDVPLFINLNGGNPYFYIEPQETREDVEWMRAAHIKPTGDKWWTSYLIDEAGVCFMSSANKPTPQRYVFTGFASPTASTSVDNMPQKAVAKTTLPSTTVIPDALKLFGLKGDVKSISQHAEPKIVPSPMYNALTLLCIPDSIHKIAFNQSGAIDLNSLAPNISTDYIFTYSNNTITHKSCYAEDDRDNSTLKLQYYKESGLLAKITIKERFTTTTIEIYYKDDGSIETVKEITSQMGTSYRNTFYFRSAKTDVMGNWVERRWSWSNETYKSEHTDSNGNTVKGRWIKNKELGGVVVEKRNIEYYSEHPSFDLGEISVGGEAFLNELKENGITEGRLDDLLNPNFEKYVTALEISRKFFPDLKIVIPFNVVMEATDEQCERLRRAGYNICTQARLTKSQRQQNRNVRINADGRKMVKAVYVYSPINNQWRLQKKYTLEYDSHNELLLSDKTQ